METSDLGRIPSGLSIVTVRAGERRTAFLGSWIQQASFEPPVVSVAIKAGRYADELLAAGGVFALNVVPAGDPALSKHFGRGFAPDQDPYAGVAVERGATGVEVLPSALAVLECRPSGSFHAGDHVVWFGTVVAARRRPEGGEPAVHIRKNGLGY